jgi:hypothetical protein
MMERLAFYGGTNCGHAFLPTFQESTAGQESIRTVIYFFTPTLHWDYQHPTFFCLFERCGWMVLFSLHPFHSIPLISTRASFSFQHFIHSFIFIYSFILSFIHFAFIHLFIHSFIHSFLNVLYSSIFYSSIYLPITQLLRISTHCHC